MGMSTKTSKMQVVFCEVSPGFGEVEVIDIEAMNIDTIAQENSLALPFGYKAEAPWCKNIGILSRSQAEDVAKKTWRQAN